MTKAQEVYEKIEAMIASGKTKKADAFKTLAEQYSRPVDSVRGAYYQHKRVLDSGGNPTSGARRTRRRETTTETAVESAVATLRRAVESIDAEIEVAKERAEEAQAEYKAMRDSAADRKAAIEAKITLLTQAAAPPNTAR